MRIPPPSPEELGEDSRATFEAASFAAGVDISRTQANHEIQALLRQEQVKFHLHVITVAGMYAFAFVLTGLFGVLLWHIAISANYAFLDDHQLNSLKQILLSGGVGAVLSNLIGRRLG